MLTGIAGECHLLFACTNIGGLFSRACFGEFMLSHTIKSQLGYPFEKEASWAFITLRFLMIRGTQPSIEEGNCSRPKEKTRR